MVVHGIELDMGGEFYTQIKKLYNPDKIISQQTLDVKFSNDDILTVMSSDGKITKKQLVIAIKKHYDKIYDDLDSVGLYNCSIDDIRLEAIVIKDTKVKLLLN